MNKICENCDTKNRLGLCKGRDGDFKYCFRRVGSTNGLEETVTPFSTLHELYKKCDWLDWIVPESLILDNKPYGDEHMVLLWGQSEDQIGTNKAQPVGYITVDSVENMEQIDYKSENMEKTKVDRIFWEDETNVYSYKKREIYYIVTIEDSKIPNLCNTTINKRFCARIIKATDEKILFELNGSDAKVVIPSDWIECLAPSKVLWRRY